MPRSWARIGVRRVLESSEVAQQEQEVPQDRAAHGALADGEGGPPGRPGRTRRSGGGRAGGGAADRVRLHRGARGAGRAHRPGHPAASGHAGPLGRGQAAQPSAGTQLHGAHRGHAERDRAAVLRSRQRLAVAVSHQPGQDQRPEPDLHRAGVQRPGRPARLGPQRDLPGPARGGHQHGGQPVVGRFGQQFSGRRCIGRIVGQRWAGRVGQFSGAVHRPPVRRLVTACRVRGRRAGWSRPTTPRS